MNKRSPIFVALVVIISFGVSYVFAWETPTLPPPNGNAFAPLNTSSNDQTKNGNLFLNALGITNPLPNALIVDGGAVFGGDVGIGTMFPTQKLDVAGYVKGGTGLCIGNDCKTSWPSGGGISSCPLGWTMIGDAGKRATYCIETNQRATAAYFNAQNICSNINDATLGRAHLCAHDEWHTACVRGIGLSNMTNDWEWTADLSGSTSILLAGHNTYGGCSAVNSGTTGNVLHPYRCCL